MQDSEMCDKLGKIVSAYEDLQAKMSDPAVLADQKEYNKLAKEYADQGPLVEKAREYLQACADIDEAKEMLDDADMKEFAQETIAAAEEKLPGLEEEIKFLLIPSDPADEKDIIVEIRAAAGGDEAAIFAGDLFKMYERFLRCGRLQGNPVQGQGRQGVLGHEIRVRRASRAARPENRVAGSYPHVHGNCGRAA